MAFSLYSGSEIARPVSLMSDRDIAGMPICLQGSLSEIISLALTHWALACCTSRKWQALTSVGSPESPTATKSQETKLSMGNAGCYLFIANLNLERSRFVGRCILMSTLCSERLIRYSSILGGVCATTEPVSRWTKKSLQALNMTRARVLLSGRLII